MQGVLLGFLKKISWESRFQGSFLEKSKINMGQVKSVQFKSGQAKLWQVSLGQVTTGQDKLWQVKSGQFKSEQH